MQIWTFARTFEDACCALEVKGPSFQHMRVETRGLLGEVSTAVLSGALLPHFQQPCVYYEYVSYIARWQASRCELLHAKLQWLLILRRCKAGATPSIT